jgi:TolB-like protein/Tfp pilus assembly protein PilF
MAVLFAALSALALLFIALRWMPLAHSRAVPVTAAIGNKRMLAVLPFRNLSGDASQDYISDGMTEELIAHLGRLNPRALGVIAPSSAMLYRNSAEDVLQIGRDLGVGYILEGSVRKIGNHIGVTAQLVNAQDRTHLWAETYSEQTTADLITVQNDVARAIAEALAIRLLPEQESLLARASTTDTEAYDGWLRGLHEWNRGTKATFLAAVNEFERAGRLDPGFALAHVGAARAYLSLADFHFILPAEGYQKAREHLDAAMRLNSAIPQLHELSAEILDKSDQNATGVDEGYRKAIALNPSDSYAQRRYALYLLGRRRYQEAVDHAMESVRLDPLSPSAFCYAAYVLQGAGHYQDSQQQVNRAFALDPNFPFALYVQGNLYAATGKLDDAIATFQKAVVTSGRTPKYVFTLAQTYLTAGRREEAVHLLQELRKQSETEFVPPEFIERLSVKLNSLAQVC